MSSSVEQHLQSSGKKSAKGREAPSKTGSNRCSVCEEPGHNRQNCPTRITRKREPCQVCQDLPHRRDVDPHKVRELDLLYWPESASMSVNPYRVGSPIRCYGCNELYRPEPAMSVHQFMQLPREDRRAIP